ncbi:MAG: SpoIIE family protein phosphatase [Gammaproteobacteria bacterium]|nr:SpoIIE family protein phosphatase [Gammaproteobacteria bacterium]
MPEQCLNNELNPTDVTDGGPITFELLDWYLANNHGGLLAADHAPTLFLAAGCAERTAFSAQGLPLGILPDADLNGVHALNFNDGDLLLMFSHVVYELTNVAGEPFGLNRLKAFPVSDRTQSAPQFLEQLGAEAEEYCGAVKPLDDITAIVIRRNVDIKFGA